MTSKIIVATALVLQIALMSASKRVSIPQAGQGTLVEKTFEYQANGKTMEGFVVYPDGIKVGSKVPGVVLIHEWNGLGDYVKRRARMIAGLGYVAFAADIYGKGIRGKTQEQSGKIASIYYNDRSLMRSRAEAALNELRKMSEVDVDHIAVMGYCFGGTTAIELAMTGEKLAAVLTFHGGLDFRNDLTDLKNVKGKMLVLHGADDPTMPSEMVESFKNEAKKDGVDMKFIAYPGAVHAFTNPANRYKPGSPVGYNESADKKSWEEMKNFFAQTL